MVEACHTHLMLLELVAAEDDQLGGMVLSQHHLDEFSAKRSGPAGDQDNLFGPVHRFSINDMPDNFIFLLPARSVGTGHTYPENVASVLQTNRST